MGHPNPQPDPVPAKKGAAKKAPHKPAAKPADPLPPTTPVPSEPPLPGVAAGPQPTKLRVEEKRVVAVKTGAVTFFDKAKAYYKGAIIFLGALLVILNEVTPVFDHLFTPGSDGQRYFSAVVAGVSFVVAVLKSNEKWVDGVDVSPPTT